MSRTKNPLSSITPYFPDSQRDKLISNTIHYVQIHRVFVCCRLLCFSRRTLKQRRDVGRDKGLK